MELADWRVRIDELNAKLVKLLNDRAKCVIGIAEIKKKKMLPILDAKREKQVIEKVLAENQGPLSDDGIRRIFECIMAEHRRLEETV